MFFLAGPAGANYQFATAFESVANDPSQKLVIAVGGGNTAAASIGGSGTNMILESYMAINYPPPSFAAGDAVTAFAGNAFFTKINGYQTTTPPTSGPYIADAMIGSTPYGLTNQAAFTLAELIVIQGSYLNNSEVIQNIEGYLSSKWWGISSSSVLTPSHPFYAKAPGNNSAVQAGFVQTSSASVTNTTTATTLVALGIGSMMIQNGVLVAGKNFRIKAAGSLGTAAIPGSLTLTLTLGGVSLGAAVLSALPASASGAGWQAEFDVICRTIAGFSGTFIATGAVNHDNGNGRGGSSINPSSSTVIILVNQNNKFDLTASWEISSQDNKVTTSMLELIFMN